MKKQQDNFRTHIPEPRWQQIVSVIVALFFIALWLWLAFRH
ncbi:MAG TPA: hypothetical protein VN778_00680 [Verrucomicrobiae bacterium]|nr:hypothetical protein [Verrucomicrobiae bacterium]